LKDQLLHCLKGDLCFIEEAGSFSLQSWDDLLELARQHAVLPLLSYQINALGLTTSVPPHIYQTLRQHYLFTSSKNILLYHELQKLLHVFNEQGIPVIILKGAYLAATVYPSIGLRSMADVDLLVHLQDIEKSIAIISGLGYQSAPYHLDMADLQLVSQHIPGFSKPNGPLIELHWTIRHPESPFLIDLDEIWAGAQPVAIGDAAAWGLSPEDQILHLSMHAYAHRYQYGLRPFIDLYYLIRHDPDAIDWERVKQKAAAWKSLRCTYLTLYLANRLFDLPTTAVLEKLTPDTFDPRLATELLDSIYGESSAAEQLGGRKNVSLSPHFFQFWDELYRTKSLKYLWKRIFVPSQAVAYDYHVDRKPLSLAGAYIRRIRDLLRRYGWVVWHNVTHRNPLKPSIDLEVALHDWISSE
jgi:hypothetical protein